MKITIQTLKMLLDEEIYKKICNLLPDEVVLSNITQMVNELDKLNDEDRNFVLSIFNELDNCINQRKKLYRVKNFTEILTFLGMIGFFAYGFVERNSQHGALFYTVVIAIFAFILILFLISKKISEKIETIKVRTK